MPRINRTKVSIRIMGRELDPLQISSLLECEPEFSYKKGEKLIDDKTGRESEAIFGMWSISVPEAKPGDIDGQIAVLLDQLVNDISIWKDIAERYRANMFCGLFMHENNEGFVLSPSTLCALGDRKIELDFDIYDNY